MKDYCYSSFNYISILFSSFISRYSSIDSIVTLLARDIFHILTINKHFKLRFGLVNSIDTYLSLKIPVLALNE